MAPEMVINQRNNEAEGGGKGLNYPRTIHVSQSTYDVFNNAKLPKRQSDPYADVFGGIADDNNEDIKNIRRYDQTAHNRLCDVVGGDKSITAGMLKRRHTQLGQTAGKAKDIRKKMDAVWFRGKMAEPAFPLIVQAMPFIKNVAVFQFSYGDVIEPVPGVTATAPGTHFEVNSSLIQTVLSPFQNASFLFRVPGTAAFIHGLKKAHDRWQPEYWTGLGESRKDMALRAEEFRRDSEETAYIMGGTAADALRQEYGEDGRLLLKKMMNEVDFSAYNYMLALQHRPSRFMQAYEQLAESGATAESTQLMFARYEEARFINGFGKDKQPVVAEWRPSAAFPGIDGLPVPVVKASYSEDESSSSRARVDFNSMERWDYTPDWREVLNHIERNTSANIRSMADLTVLKDNLGAAKQGDVSALLELAELCKEGALGIPEGEKASRFARQLYIAAANKGSVEAQYRLGLLHADKRFTGLDGLRNDNVAVDWLTKAAKQGHLEAQAELGLMYATGRSGEDAHVAATFAHMWCENAVKAGVRRPDVFFALGRLYQNNLVTLEEDDQTDETRIATMEKWYLEAIKEGHVGAMRELGLAHLNRTKGLSGTGQTKGANDADAAEYLRMAAQHNDLESIYYLGEMYLNGRINAENLVAKHTAVQFFKDAADSGFAQAQFKLGLMLVNGEIDAKDGEPAYRKAARRFAEAAAQGHIGAQCELAHLYVEGLARPKDGKSPDAAALDLYKQAADKGSLVARLALVLLYRAGRGDTKPGAPTNQMIAKYLELAASHEEADPGIAYDLAELYAQRTSGLENGRDGDKLAVKWYTQAANKGLADASYKLAQLYLEKGRVDDLTDQERVALAEPWYVKAADAGHEQAQLALGLLHLTRAPGLTGTGKTKGANDADAARYLQMAADQNNPEARYFLGEMCLYERASIEALSAKDAVVESEEEEIDFYVDIRLPADRGRKHASIKDATTKEAAVDYIKFAADDGFAPAQFRLGLMLASGEADIKDGKPDYQGAADCFAAAAKQGHIEALCELAKLFQEELAHPLDGKSPYDAAEDLYKQAANKGSVVAQLALADWYVPINSEVDQEIAKYLELAAKNGSADAQYKLASRHLASCKSLPAGEEAEQKATEAIELLKQAAQQEHPKACYKLGYMHEQPHAFGLRKEPDFAKAAELHRVAAEDDFAPAQYRLGKLYWERKAAPEGVNEQGTRDAAKRLFELADAQGHVHGSFYYGLMLVEDGSGSRDPRALRGRMLMEEAAGKGDPELQYMLAERFFSFNPEAHKSLTQDGINWLEKAVVQGHTQALRKLEQLYVNDQFRAKIKRVLSPEQIERAQKYFQNAAVNKEDPYSMRFLGWLHESGLATKDRTKNLFIAGQWYDKAAQKIDDAYTLFKLGTLTEAGKNARVLDGDEDKKAFEYYQRAADMGYADAIQARDRMRKQDLGGLSKDTPPDGKTVRQKADATGKGTQKTPKATTSVNDAKKAQTSKYGNVEITEMASESDTPPDEETVRRRATAAEKGKKAVQFTPMSPTDSQKAQIIDEGHIDMTSESDTDSENDAQEVQLKLKKTMRIDLTQKEQIELTQKEQVKLKSESGSFSVSRLLRRRTKR